MAGNHSLREPSSSGYCSEEGEQSPTNGRHPHGEGNWCTKAETTIEQVNLRQYMKGLQKGTYTTSVLCLLNTADFTAETVKLNFTHRHAHGDQA